MLKFKNSQYFCFLSVKKALGAFCELLYLWGNKQTSNFFDKNENFGVHRCVLIPQTVF